MVDTTLDNTLGSMFIGEALPLLIIGSPAAHHRISGTQHDSHLPYRQSGGDHIILKLMIGLLWAFDAIHIALLSATAYNSAVKQLGDADALARAPSNTVVGVKYCNACVSHALTQSSVSGLQTEALLQAIGDSSTLRGYGHDGSLQCAFSVSNGNRVVCGLLLSLLQRQLRRVTFNFNLLIQCYSIRAGLCQCYSSTLIRIIHVLQVYTINAGIPTSLCSLVALILYAIAPNTMIFIITVHMLPKVFLNVLLAILNARKSLRRQLGTVISMHMVTTASVDMDRGSEHDDVESGRWVRESEHIIVRD
ncbi:hypothetical protein C8Q74DRAFT_1215828 [Fomes fomentarius]|nr:hypothetical protein C8Q74DRAFT_1215828 [Fomes fomentarius]